MASRQVKNLRRRRIRLWRKENKEPVTFGLLQHEIDNVIEHHKKETNRELERSIMKELAATLPKSERLTAKHPHHHTDIVVKSTGAQISHSPFVLDLTELIEKKKQKEEKRRRLISLICSSRTKQPAAGLKEQHSDKKTPSSIILLAHEERVMIFDHDKKTARPHYHCQFTTKPWYYHTSLPHNWTKKLVVYAAVFFLIISPIKAFGYYYELRNSQAKILNYAASAYEDIKVAGQKLFSEDAADAGQQFSSASRNFDEAQKELEKINAGLKTIINIIPRDRANIADAEYLLDIGKDAAGLGETLSAITASFRSSDGKLTERLATLQNELAAISRRLSSINSMLNKIREQAIPEEKQIQFISFKKYLSLLNVDVKELSEFSQALNRILGADYTKRYLFVFQNNNELRPTGGFLGSFALVDIDRGEIKNLEIPKGGTYDLQGSLIAKRISPAPLQIINPLWEMQDANWFPDFPTSAQKIKWFYENSGGPTIDGVIAINASFIPSLLKIIGPIQTADGALNADNFVIELQKAISAKRHTRAPKEILAELAPELLNKLFDAKGENILKIGQAFKNGLDKKEIQLYFNDPSIEEKITSYGWTGKMLDTSKDYLAIIAANIGGGKTDSFIEENIDLISNIGNDGKIINTLTISRKHNGSLSDEFGKTSNLAYLRIYAPLGSQLLEISGWSEVPADKFEKPESNWQADEFLEKIQGNVWLEPNSGTRINNELNKTVFGNWLQVDPGEEKQLTIKYQLPYSFAFAEKSKLNIFSAEPAPKFYSLLLQKQSGAQNTKFSITFNLPEGHRATKTFGESATNHFDQIKFETKLDEDAVFAFIAD